MSFFVHTSIFKVDAGVHPAAYANLPPDGRRMRLASFSALLSGNGQVRVGRRRRTAYHETHSDDTYQALDLDFDDQAVAELGARVFGGLDGMQLAELSYRFLDFGFLYVVARFDLSAPMDDPGRPSITEISRCQKRLLADLQTGVSSPTLFGCLAGDGLLESKVPTTGGATPSLLTAAAVDWDDYYAYSTHLFLVREENDVIKACLQGFEVEGAELRFGDHRVLLSEHFPLWIVESDIASEELMYLLEADALYLAEQTFHSSCINAYQAILRRFVVSQQDSPPLSSGGLRHILISNKLTIALIAQRSECFDADQNRYLKACKGMYPLDQGYALYRDIEETLKYVVHDQEQKDKVETDSVIETILICFTALTVLSVFKDVTDFVNVSKFLPEPLSLARALVLLAALALVLVVVRVLSRKRRSRAGLG